MIKPRLVLHLKVLLHIDLLHFPPLYLSNVPSLPNENQIGHVAVSQPFWNLDNLFPIPIPHILKPLTITIKNHPLDLSCSGFN